MASKRCKNTKKWESYCECGSPRCGRSICKHHRVRSQCKECGGFPVLARQMFKAARARARKHNQLFNITVSDILTMIGDGTCPVFGTRYNLRSHKGSTKTSASLDRFIPSKGYTKNNCLVISQLANLIKANATADQVQQVANWMQRRNK